MHHIKVDMIPKQKFRDGMKPSPVAPGPFHAAALTLCLSYRGADFIGCNKALRLDMS